MESFRTLRRMIEDYAALSFQSLRSHLSAIGGFLMVVSFIDYGSRGITH